MISDFVPTHDQSEAFLEDAFHAFAKDVILRVEILTLREDLYCQIGVSLHCATDMGCFPLDFQLYLPRDWTDDPVRRRSVGLPDEVVFKHRWELGLEMIDRVRDWNVPTGVIVAGLEYGKPADFQEQLDKRKLDYVLERDSEIRVQPVGDFPRLSGSSAKYQAWPLVEDAWDVAKALPDDAWVQIAWRQGAGEQVSSFCAVRVLPRNKAEKPAGDVSGRWLLIEATVDTVEPTNFWLSNLPENTSLEELVYWAKIRWWVEENHRRLENALGLGHFEGRSWAGWNHHVTLTMLAYGFLAHEDLRNRKDYWIEPSTSSQIAKA